MVLDIDYIAHTNELSNFNPRIKIILSLLVLIIALISNSPIISFLIGIFIAIFLVFFAEISFRNYLSYMTIPLAFAVITFIFMALFFGDGKVLYDFGFLYLTIKEDSLSLAISVFGRVFGSFSALGLLSLTTPIADILNEMRNIKVPIVLIDLSMLMYRTIFILLEETESIYNSQNTRLGYKGLKNSYKSLGSLASTIFIRAWERGERFQISLDSRCYTGQLPVYKKTKLSK